MPYFKTTTNVPIPADKRESIKTRMGQDVNILGKTEDWLMVEFCENASLYFKGTDEPAAIVGVDLFGAAGKEAYAALTAALTETLTQALDIPADRIFVKYSEYANWGWKGRNF